MTNGGSPRTFVRMRTLMTLAFAAAVTVVLVAAGGSTYTPRNDGPETSTTIPEVTSSTVVETTSTTVADTTTSTTVAPTTTTTPVVPAPAAPAARPVTATPSFTG